ncbi:hypothetical protein [Sedimenticola hydrogenitrophicus]|uniref:hypothetical protein n=1 Tax=Sedimenticola hydrogenitrophicus TaxID=2967975 RepID=UPI003AAB58BA
MELLGDYGHINHESGLGEWEQGLKWLDELITTAGQTHTLSIQHEGVTSFYTEACW